jgi:hypothetical protein
LLEGVYKILRIGVKSYKAGLAKRRESFYRSGKLHAVIRRFTLSSAKLTLIFSVNKNSSPAALAGISSASAVGIKTNLFH